MNQSRNGLWRSALVLCGAGFVLVAAIGAGGLLGTWLDKKLDTQPWLLVSGLLLGSVAGFLELYRMIRKYIR